MDVYEDVYPRELGHIWGLPTYQKVFKTTQVDENTESERKVVQPLSHV